MRDYRLGTHTIGSHGVRIARLHMHDWIILVILVVMEFLLAKVIPPFHRFVGRDMMSDLKYPMKSNTVPSWSVPMIAVLVPFAFILTYYIMRRNVYDFHHSILGLLYSVFITGVITDAIKDAVGRPRPDFFWRCFPDGNDVYDSLHGGVVCHGDAKLLRIGHKSFPSGHTSWSFAGLGFLSLYLSGKIQAFDQRGHVAKLCIFFSPLLVAALIAISSVDNYRHHWQDVFGGGLLGLTVATLCYLQFFAAPYHSDAWGPRAYFQMLAEFASNPEQPVVDHRRSSQVRKTDTAHGLSLQSEEVRGSNMSGSTSHTLDIEAGKT